MDATETSRERLIPSSTRTGQEFDLVVGHPPGVMSADIAVAD